MIRFRSLASRMARSIDYYHFKKRKADFHDPSYVGLFILQIVTTIAFVYVIFRLHVNISGVIVWFATLGDGQPELANNLLYLILTWPVSLAKAKFNIYDILCWAFAFSIWDLWRVNNLKLHWDFPKNRA